MVPGSTLPRVGDIPAGPKETDNFPVNIVISFDRRWQSVQLIWERPSSKPFFATHVRVGLQKPNQKFGENVSRTGLWKKNLTTDIVYISIFDMLKRETQKQGSGGQESESSREHPMGRRRRK